MSGAQDRKASNSLALGERRWNLTLTADDVAEALLAHPNVDRRCLAEETEDTATDVLPFHEGRVFLDERPGCLVLWRRPSRSVLASIPVHGRVPYPDALELDCEEMPFGCRVVGRWRRHPIAVAAMHSLLLWSLLVVGVIVGGMLLFSDTVSLPVLLLVAGMTAVMGGRFFIGHAAKAEILRVAHATLAPHELGDGDLDASPYRIER